MPILRIPIAELNLHGGTQQRVSLDLSHVAKIEEILQDDGLLDPISVIYDEVNYWVTDGFHRVQAYKNQGFTEIDAIATKGTHRDAILASIQANANHLTALSRSRADKRRAVETLLKDPEWSQWSDRQIAKLAQVSHPMVAAIRKSLKIISDKQQWEEKHLETLPPNPAHSAKNPVTRNPVTKKNNMAIAESQLIEHETTIPFQTGSIKPNVQDLYIGFKSNLDLMPSDYLEDALWAIAESLKLQGKTYLITEI
jgi:hypothetical protein